MTGLALRSLRARRTAFLATALSVLLGTAVLTAFLTLLETGLGDDVSSAGRETLVTVASVVGGWGTVIIVFSVASMLTLTVRRRAEEFGLLRTLGTSRRQVRGIVLGEALTVALVAAVPGILPGWLIGRVVLDLLQSAGLVAVDVQLRLGALSIGSALGGVLVACAAAGLLAARSVTRGSAQECLTAGRVHRERLGGWRILLGVALLATGAGYTTVTITVMADSADPYGAMSTAGPASVFWSLGLAAFAPVLLRATAVLVGPVIRVVGRGVPASLALSYTRRRAHDLSGMLVPILIFVGTSTGTLYLMQIESRTAVIDDSVGDTVRLVNSLVVGMISAFAAIMVVNGTVAAIADRRREFAQQRLAGVTRGELVSTVAIESAVLIAAALVFGGLASLGTVIPYSVVKTDGWLPGTGPSLFLGVAAVAVVVALGTAVAATRRASAVPALRTRWG